MEFLKSDDFDWNGAEIIGEVIPPNQSATVSAFLNNMNMNLNNSNLSPGEDEEMDQFWAPEDIAAYQALKSKRKKCIMYGCTAKSFPIAKSYHQLPVRNLEVWQKWVEAIRWSKNDPDWLPLTDQPLVCSRHFIDSDFISYHGSTRMRLNHSSAPSVYIDPPEGAIMDPKFGEERELPNLDAFNLFKQASQNRSTPSTSQSQSQSQTNNSLSTSISSTALNGQQLSGRKTSGIRSFNAYLNGGKKRNGSLLQEPLYEDAYDGNSNDNYEDQGGMLENYYDEEAEPYDEDMFVDPSARFPKLIYGDTEITAQETDDSETDAFTTNTFNSFNGTKKSLPKLTQAGTGRTKILSKPRITQPSSTYNLPSRQNLNMAPPPPPLKLKPSPGSTASKQYLQQLAFRRGGALGFNGGGILGNTSKNSVTSRLSSSSMSMTSNNMSKVHPVQRKVLTMKIPSLVTNRSGQGQQVTPQKHKIGMSKCRLIVDSLEAELTAAKKKVAKQLNIPYEVVNGIWKIKDKINDTASKHGSM